MPPYLAFALLPFYILFITSLKSRQEIANLGNSPFWTSGIATENYTYLATHTGYFEHWMINTLIVTVVSTIISVAVVWTLGTTPCSICGRGPILR